MRSRTISPRTLALWAALGSLGAVNCSDDKVQPMPFAPVEPVAFAVHVSYCKGAAPGLAVPGTVARLVQGSAVLEAATDANGLADFGEIAPGAYDVTVSRETAPMDPQCIGGGDITRLISFMSLSVPLSECATSAADVDQDGAVTTRDLENLRRYAVLDTAHAGFTSQWRFPGLEPHIDLSQASALEIRALVLGDVDLSWPIRP